MLYEYRAFGEQLKRLDSSGSETGDGAKYSYGGKELDAGSDLYYFNARYYDATTGRFINVDPIQDGSNWYVYVRNNPLGLVDPTGLESADAAYHWYRAVREEKSNTWVTTQEFGAENSSQYPSSDNIHSGWDGKRIKVDKNGSADTGSNTTETATIYSDGSGVVTQIGDHKDYGLHVRIEGEDGLTTLYAHLSELAPELKVDSRVHRTTALGRGGNTGNSTGPHLHKERYFKSRYPSVSDINPGHWNGSFVLTDYKNNGYRISFPVGPSWHMRMVK